MKKHDKSSISKARQNLLFLCSELERLVKQIVNSKEITKGTICEKRRKCGNQKCRCSKGELHITRILSYSHKGKSRIIHLSKYSLLELTKLEKQVKEYQQFRKSRAKIVAYAKLLIKEINQMEQALKVAVAPSAKGGDND
ncbi:MAG: hypothetical protein A2Y62_14765 [Candidatus Fischerbacteria bacterium RBG_13_37_8]|uniref:DUF6788 domain-containing protein n=1 Tax=Candidatus Fischerbacteria bacterium RBG_13_37_8 TaxID=1817863 RepID=A0A1F5VMV1_9BACT|nr:MAG: hypothetical protein A2Y62_14765 [Candidatus Fischerbacteria bacterium RBG_13_37_8]